MILEFKRTMPIEQSSKYSRLLKKKEIDSKYDLYQRSYDLEKACYDELINLNDRFFANGYTVQISSNDSLWCSTSPKFSMTIVANLPDNDMGKDRYESWTVMKDENRYEKKGKRNIVKQFSFRIQKIPVYYEKISPLELSGTANFQKIDADPKDLIQMLSEAGYESKYIPAPAAFLEVWKKLVEYQESPSRSRDRYTEGFALGIGLGQ